MLQDKHNVIPVSMAVLLHVAVFGSLLVAVDFGRREMPAMPLAIKGTLVTDNAVVIPPRVEEQAPPEPQPEPEPLPDTSEQERLAAEEQKRREDARLEQERLQKLEQIRKDQERKAEEAEQQRIAAEAETKRLAEEAERRRKAEEEQRRRDAEAEKERQRLEAERKREEEIERQRRENERLRAEAEAARRAEIDAESERIAAVDAGELAAYRYALQQKVERNWIKPASSPPDLECEVRVQQLPGGDVISVSILSCNGDAAVRRSIEAAIQKASPLPTPRNPSLFDRNLRFTFRPEQ